MMQYKYIDLNGNESRFTKSPLKKLYIGDLHASTFKLYKVLLDHFVIQSNCEDKILNFYTQLNLEVDDKRKVLLSILNLLKESKVVNKDLDLVLLGDTIFDKGTSDFTMINFINHLRNSGLKIRFILSNHDWSYFNYIYNIPSPLNYKKNTSYLDCGDEPITDHETYVDYISSQEFLNYELNNEVLLTHTLIQNEGSSEEIGFPNVINNLCSLFALSLANFVEEINGEIKDFTLSLKYKDTVNEEEVRKIIAISNALWYVNKDKEGQFVNQFEKPIKTYIHGHYFYASTGWVMNNPDYATINLNNASFKSELGDTLTKNFGACPLLIE